MALYLEELKKESLGCSHIDSAPFALLSLHFFCFQCFQSHSHDFKWHPGWMRVHIRRTGRLLITSPNCRPTDICHLQSFIALLAASFSPLTHTQARARTRRFASAVSPLPKHLCRLSLSSLKALGAPPSSSATRE